MSSPHFNSSLLTVHLQRNSMELLWPKEELPEFFQLENYNIIVRIIFKPLDLDQMRMG